MYLNLPQRLNAMPWILVIPGYAFAHGVAVWIGTQVLFNPSFLTPFWPASGLLVAILLLEPTRRWPAWLAAALVGHFVFANLGIGGDVNIYLGLAFALFGTLGAPIIALMVRRACGDTRPADRPLAALGALVVTALLIPAATGYLSAQLSVLMGSATPMTLIWRSWWSAEALGVIAVAPLILAWATMRGFPWAGNRWRMTEVLLATVGLLAVTDIVCSQPSGLSFTVLFVAPFLIWLGLRADARVASAAGLASLSIALYSTLQGSGPFIGGPLSDRFSALGIHALYGSLIPASLAMAYLVEHRRALQIRFQLAELLLELLTYLVDSSPDELRQRIQQALEAIGGFTGADRAKLMLFEADTVRVFASWTRPSVTKNDEVLDGQPMAHFPWAITELSAGRSVSFDRADLPGTVSDAERRRYTALQTEAFRVLPVLEGDELRGAVALAWANAAPEAEAERLTLLPVATQLFASGLRRARAQEELRAYQDSLRLLASELSLAEERVRRATAVHLHDSIGQSLAVARIKLGQLLQETSNETLSQLREILDEAIGHTRHMIADLSPPVLYELGLVQAIRWLADREHRRGDFRYEINESGTPGDLGEEAKVAIFQCYRELLANVVKHAHAAAVRISVNWLDDHVEVVVADDGVGFRTASQLGPTPSGGHFGLFSVRERVQSLGGHFQLESTRGLGTQAHISVPLNRQQIAV